jgi:hypothetical protein
MRVASGGAFEERRFDAGDVLLCVQETRDGAVLVLAPAGMGRPRLARRRGSRLVGAMGETLSGDRWRVVGQLYAVQHAERGLVPFGQLGLFAAA